MATPERGNNAGASEDTSTYESEWEYEYDENETEDYYFTLDLTTQQPHTASDAPKRKRSSKKSAVRQAEVDGTPTKQLNEAHEGPGKLQILGLHSRNPLIKLDDGFYSCHWSTDLGSQFYVTRPGVTERPLRPGKVLDVLGISRARLVATPATFRQRKSNALIEMGSSVVDAIPVEDDDDDVDIVADSPNDALLQGAPGATLRETQFATIRENTRDPAVRAQASFLERLSAIKRKKGETDTIPLYGIQESKLQPVKPSTPELAIAPAGTVQPNGGHATGKPHKRAHYKKRQSSKIAENTTDIRDGSMAERSADSLSRLHAANSGRTNPHIHSAQVHPDDNAVDRDSMPLTAQPLGLDRTEALQTNTDARQHPEPT